MRCQKHLAADLSSIDGVCATCLRERLLVVIEAQTKLDLEARIAGKSGRISSEATTPEEIEFPPCRTIANASVKSHHGHTLSDQLFYSTPQLPSQRKKNKFSMVSNFFRSKSSDPNFNSKPKELCVTNSPSWISSIMPLKEKKKKKSCIFTLTDPNASRVMQRPCRGMSPAEESEGEFCSPRSTPQWKETPQRTSAPVQFRCKRLNQARNITGFALCLSPLVRPSPNRNWNQKGIAPEISVAGDVRVPVKPHIGVASAICANRSKKLAQCGRFHPNH